MAGLSGMKEICRYYNRSESTVVDRIQKEGFSAVKIGGGWEPDTELIDDWRVEVIKKNERSGKKEDCQNTVS